MDAPLHVGRPNIGDRNRFAKRLDDILDRAWLTNAGHYVQAFEKRVSEVTGVRNCIAMCNGTIALEIVIRALGLTGEVIVPSFTFIATANALQWQEITPVFCDIDPVTHTLDPSRVEMMITPRTTGIIGVHLWGRGCNVTALKEIADRRNLKLVFDASHAFGCTVNQKMIGGFGNAEVFSFHATKFINTLEGGAVLTNDDALADKLRLMKNFGFTQYDNTEHIGINGKMNEVSAAMGLTNLESMEHFIAINRRNYELYRSMLSGTPGLHMIEYDAMEKNNYQYIVLEVDSTKTGISRDGLIDRLHANKVLARRYFHPGCHRMMPYRSYFPNAGLMLPETEKLSGRVICLPNGTAIGEREINYICEIIQRAIMKKT
ncbi:aminotransferase class I/II-fold pyridoxal phosphate-dependent enzyme [Desulfatiferula olefinivorans]